MLEFFPMWLAKNEDPSLHDRYQLRPTDWRFSPKFDSNAGLEEGP
jgi:hypothetical protein